MGLKLAGRLMSSFFWVVAKRPGSKQGAVHFADLLCGRMLASLRRTWLQPHAHKPVYVSFEQRDHMFMGAQVDEEGVFAVELLESWAWEKRVPLWRGGGAGGWVQPRIKRRVLMWGEGFARCRGWRVNVDRVL